MRKLIACLYFSLLGSLCLHAQTNFGPVEKNPHKKVIKLNLAALAAGNISPMFEYTIGTRYSVSAGANYMSRAFTKGDLSKNMKKTDLHVKGYGATLEFRYYTSKTKDIPGGFFLGSFMQYSDYKQDATIAHRDTSLIDQAHYDAQSLSLGIVFGYQFLLSERFTLEIFADPYYSATFMQSKELPSQNFRLDFYPFPDKDGTLPGLRAGLSLGYLF